MYRPRRRGLGDGKIVNGVYVMDSPINTDIVSASGQNLYLDSAGNPMALGAGSGSFTDWLNANGKMIAIGGAAFLGLMLVAKAGR